MAKDAIIIAGAGPAGLMTALGLARQGVPVVVLEAETTPPADLRATTFHPPTLEMLEDIGAVERLVARGNVAPRWQFRDRRHGKVAEFDLGIIADATRHPYRLQCEQHHLAEILLSDLRTFGNAQILFGAAVEGFEQDATGVTVRCRNSHAADPLRGSFLVGADGGRSQVRKALGVDFEGFTYSERIVQAGTPFDFHAPMPDLAEINYISDREEWCVLLRVSGYWRAAFPLPPDEDESEALSDSALQRRLHGLVRNDRDFDLVHRRCWRLHQRVASDFRQNRVALVGDAAHVNSPHGGMGMNSAIHDAVNLSDKLAKLWHGEEDLSLLDRYTRQRRFVALEDVRVQSMRNSQLMSERDEAVRREHLDHMRRCADDPARAHAFLLDSSMISGLKKSATIS